MKRLHAFAFALSAALGVNVALAQGYGGGGGNGGQGGGNKPPVELSNNLSYPSVMTAGTVTLPGVAGQWSLEGEYPTSMSYGCAVPEDEYPNTSCVSSDGLPLSYDDCVARCGVVPVERIYWQKDPANVWQAENLQNQGTQVANFVDWGDNLEVITWTASSNIRVEVTPFATLPIEQLGFQMWHVFGQGPDEMWGVRATDVEDVAEAGVPYGYLTSNAIVRSPYARLNLAKLSAGVESCTPPSPYADQFIWNAAADNKWGAIQVDDLSFTPELNIGGKFVYGYNWMTKRMVMPIGVDKAGWWRLTFYAPDVQFAADTAIEPPALPDSESPPPTPALVTIQEEGALYVPIVDDLNHITYIDICLGEGRGNSGRPKNPR